VFQQDGIASTWSEVERTIESELGMPIRDVFASFTPTPLHVGTVGEVYEATLRSGEEVVVKVLTPSRRDSIVKMLDRLEKVAIAVHQKRESLGVGFDSISLYEEFEESMRKELDFLDELKNADSLRGGLPDGITIPSHIGSLCTHSLLTQERAMGSDLKSLSSKKSIQRAIHQLGGLLLQATKAESFHYDLHAGNIKADESGNVELLDYGRVGSLGPVEQKLLIPFLSAVKDRDAVQVATLLSVLSGNEDGDASTMAARLKELYSTTPSEAPLPVVISSTFSEARQSGFPPPSGYLQLLEAVIKYEGTARSLDPNFDLAKTLEALVAEQMMKEKFSAVRDLFKGSLGF